MTSLLDVIVVGAGPAGSAAACALASRGHRVLLVDRARFPRDKPCGDYCDPGATRALAALGCQDAVLAAGAVPISTMRVVAHNGLEFEGVFPGGPGLLIPRRRLDATLLAHAARSGADVLEGTPLDDVRLDAGHIEVRATHANSRALRARLLIAADGMRSAIARRVGLRPALSSGRYTVGAYFSGLPRATPGGELHLGPNLYCGVAHFGQGAANVCMALPRAFFHRRTPDEAFHDGLRALPTLAQTLAEAQRETPYRCVGPVGFATRNVLSERVMLAGDAAGQIEPMTGQGIFLALRSGMLAAEVATHALDTGDFSRQGLRAYAVRRSKEFAGKLLVARVLQTLAFRSRLTPYFVRRLAAMPTLASELVGTTGDAVPSDTRHALSFVTRLIAGLDAHRA